MTMMMSKNLFSPLKGPLHCFPCFRSSCATNTRQRVDRRSVGSHIESLSKGDYCWPKSVKGISTKQVLYHCCPVRPCNIHEQSEAGGKPCHYIIEKETRTLLWSQKSRRVLQRCLIDCKILMTLPEGQVASAKNGMQVTPRPLKQPSESTLPCRRQQKLKRFSSRTPNCTPSWTGKDGSESTQK